MFGEERLLKLVERSTAPGAPLLDRILAAVLEFAGGRPEDDDRTLLTLGPD